MKRYALFASLIVFGMGLGVPAGYLIGRDPKTSAMTSDEVQLKLPKNYFADLPKVGEGDERLITVRTLTLSNNTKDGESLDLPIVYENISLP